MSNGLGPSIFQAKSKDTRANPKSYPVGTITPLYSETDPATGKATTVPGKTQKAYGHTITREKFFEGDKPTSPSQRLRRRRAFAGTSPVTGRGD
jgi:hypothetical protein